MFLHRLAELVSASPLIARDPENKFRATVETHNYASLQNEIAGQAAMTVFKKQFLIFNS